MSQLLNIVGPSLYVGSYSRNVFSATNKNKIQVLLQYTMDRVYKQDKNTIMKHCKFCPTCKVFCYCSKIPKLLTYDFVEVRHQSGLLWTC